MLLFGVQPLAAVSSDLVAAFVMKPVGGAVHARRGTVHKGRVLWLAGVVVAPLVWRYLRASMKARARVRAATRTPAPETARPGDPAGMRVFAPDPAA